MDAEKKLTPFEKAFYDYREGIRMLEYAENEIESALRSQGSAEKRRTEALEKKHEGMAELKRHMTLEAFTELTGSGKVTP